MRTSVSTSKVAQEIIARRRISDNRINNAKRAANSFATRLEKTEANLAKVNSSIAGLKDTGIFSSEKARLEMIKRGLEAEIASYSATFNEKLSLYNGYLDKNVKLITEK